jgi:predicted nucleic acid-binding protein
MLRVNYFLDTNAVIALLKDRPAGVRSRLRRVASRGAAVAIDIEAARGKLIKPPLASTSGFF